MKERPILFSSTMVQAILDNRKTQTRRIIKPQPIFGHGIWDWKGYTWTDKPYCSAGAIFTFDELPNPYGQIGDRLWVKETTCTLVNPYTNEKTIIYRADPLHSSDTLVWKPSIFMPRNLSRITLEITGIRVERVQEIDPQDVNREGVCYEDIYGKFSVPDYDAFLDAQANIAITAFHRLWDSINAKRGYSWESNPWVWVIEFKRLAPQPNPKQGGSEK